MGRRCAWGTWMKKDKLRLSLWLSLGFGLNQLLHTVAYSPAMHIEGFPNILVPIRLAYALSGVISLLSFLSLFFFFAGVARRPALIAVVFLPLELLSQVFSSSIIKGVFECLFTAIVYGVLIIEKFYDETS